MMSGIVQCKTSQPFRPQTALRFRCPLINYAHTKPSCAPLYMARCVSAVSTGTSSFKADGPFETNKRKSANYEPSLWGDYFITYVPPQNQVPKELMEQRVKELKDEVRTMVRSTTNVSDMMNLVDRIQQLGIDYHFNKEIDDAICYLHDAKFESDDLQQVALRFRLLRQHGYNVSSDVFCKFKDSDGNFDEKLCQDDRALLSLYNAGYLAFPGEAILDEAISFARNHLTSNVNQMKIPLKRQVLRALEAPLHRMVPRVKAMFYIEDYEDSKNDTLLQLAKMDYNLVQSLHLEELKILSIWWKELNIAENLKYSRDRLIENYFAALAMYYEPQYSRARVMLTKIWALGTIIDDTFDVYATYEECKLLNGAIQRWDENASDCLPKYLVNLYIKFIRTFNGFQDELQPSEKYRVSYIIDMTKTLIDGYMEEVEWHAKKQVPTFESSRKPAIDRQAGSMVACCPVLGMGEEVTEEAMQWLASLPDIVMESMKVCRYTDDVVSFERESMTAQAPTSIMCYMMEHNLAKEEAVAKFKSLTEESWKRLNRAYACRRATDVHVPVQILDRMLNFARFSAEVQYVRGFTACSQLKDFFASLVLRQFPLD